MFAHAVLLASLLTPQSATHGAMVGSVGPDTAMVWTRADGACRVQVRYGKGPGENLDQVSQEVAANDAADFTAKIVLTGLQPGTEYRYQVTFTMGNAPQPGPRGRFRTAPAPEKAAPFTFAFSADVLETGTDPMWPRIATHRPDLYLSLGDMPYADEAHDLAGYRRANQKVREHPALQEFFENVPIAPVWDDHEVANDWDAAMDPQRVAAGTQAWREYMPVVERGPVYRSFRWGKGVEVFLLDCRSMRGRNADPDLPEKSMLGAAQVRWLIEGLAASKATFKLVCTSVPLRFGSSGKDSWQGYQHERDAILAELEARGVGDVVFVTADTHWAAVHAHREGRAEFQVGPLAAALGDPPAVPEPQVRFLAKELSYGVITFDPAAEPPALVVSIHGTRGELHRSVITVSRPARVQVTGAGEGVRLVPRSGGLTLVEHGVQVVWPRVSAGACEVRFAAGTAGKPESMALQLAPGARASVAAGAPRREVLLWDDFEVPHAMTVVDIGTRGAPSAWFTSGGWLWQSSGIRIDPPQPEDPFAPATLCVRGSREWTDVNVRARLWTADAGTVALLFRYVDPDNHCRLVWNGKKKVRRLEAVTAGRVKVLAEDQAELVARRVYDCTVQARGPDFAVWIDGAAVFAAKGEAGHGAVALATDGNELAAFDDLEVRAADASSPVTDASTSLTGWSEPGGGRPGERWSTGAVLHCAPRPGAEAALMRAEAVKDGRIAVRARWLGGEVGLLARSGGPGDQYELRWDGNKLVLQRRIGGGKPWVIGSGPAPGRDGVFHELALQCVGFRLEAWFDDAPVVREMDGAHTSGHAGLLVSDAGSAEFTGFRVLEPAVPLPVLATVVDEEGHCAITANCPGVPGGAYALALWLDRAHPMLPGGPGREPALLVGPAEPMFLLGGSRAFAGAFGELDGHGGLTASFTLGRHPALRGQVVLIGGFVMDAEGREVQGVLPRAATIL